MTFFIKMLKTNTIDVKFFFYFFEFHFFEKKFAHPGATQNKQKIALILLCKKRNEHRSQ